jgi:catechol 2,3-dioxygenase-like lactoylglutathione lyase family enzyme
MNAVELKAFVPARDYELSKRFYQDLGFTLASDSDGIAYFHCGDHSAFLLKRFYVQEFAENLMMHLLVEDVDAWWSHVQRQAIAVKYGVRVEPPAQRPWRMRDFVLADPSGVLWRIAQNTP